MGRESQIRSYKFADCVTFRKTREKFGGLSNMAGGYPFEISGIAVPSSETLYQACRFPHMPDIQRMILDQTSPMTAKMVSKPHRTHTRSDWVRIRVRVMRWVLRVKLANHWKRFGELLLKTDGKSIVEDSHRDDFWGAQPQEDCTLVGMNVLGRLLMELREELKGPKGSALKVVAPPQITNFLLLGELISEIIPEESDNLADPDLLQQTSLWNTESTCPPGSESV